MGIFAPPKIDTPPPPPLPPAAHPPSLASGSVQATGAAARQRITDAASSGFGGVSKTGPGGVKDVPSAAQSLTGLKTTLGA